MSRCGFLNDLGRGRKGREFKAPGTVPAGLKESLDHATAYADCAYSLKKGCARADRVRGRLDPVLVATKAINPAG